MVIYFNSYSADIGKHQKIVSQEMLTNAWSRNLDKNPFTAAKPVLKQGLLVEEKALLPIALISALLLTLAGTQLVNFAAANPNPFPFGENVSPDSSTKPPTITISSVIVNGSNVAINFTADVGESTTAFYTRMSKVYYTSDWNRNQTYLYQFYDPAQGTVDVSKRTEYSLCELNVPEGKHTITVYALESGSYIRQALMHAFTITGFSSANFTIDTMPPEILTVSVENKTYETSEIPLIFTTNEPVTRILYSLDGLDNVTIAGNTTLTNLHFGEHNVTFYATDEAGNTGTSKTISFTVKESELSQNTLVAVASGASVAIVGVGLLIYFKKRKH